MNDSNEDLPDNVNDSETFVENIDYYFENGLMVLTSAYLLKRGFCCKSGCRHCPYGYTPEALE